MDMNNTAFSKMELTTNLYLTSANNFTNNSSNITLQSGSTDELCYPAPEDYVYIDMKHCPWTKYQTVVAYIGIVMAIPGILGNIFSFIVLHLKYPKTMVNFYFRSLAVADCMFLLCSFVSEIIQLALGDYLFSTKAYAVMFSILKSFVGEIFLLMSIWLTVVLAYTRYRAVSDPINTQVKAKPLHAKIMTAAILITVSVIKLIQYCVVVKCAYDPTKGHICYYNYDIYRNHFIDGFFFGLFFFVLPVIPLIICSVGLWKSLQRIGKEHVEGMPSMAREAREITKTVIAIVAVFIITFFPTFLWALTYLLDSWYCYFFWNYCESLILDPTIFLLEHVNSSVNFLIYFICNGSFRKHCRSLINKPMEQSRSSEDTGSSCMATTKQ